MNEEGDLEEPLTLAHLMSGRRLTMLPPNLSPQDEEEDSTKGPNRRMKYLSIKLDHSGNGGRMSI